MFEHTPTTEPDVNAFRESSKQSMEDYRREREKERQQRRAAARELWSAVPLDPIPFLATLRQYVLDRSHTRLPKWRFHIEPDFAIQLQPKPAERRDKFAIFAGLAIVNENPKYAFKHPIGTTTFKFGIENHESTWQFKPWGCKRMQDHFHFTSLDFKARVVDVFRSGCFDRYNPDRMLAPQCMCCGKALTDPASMARHIGPECAGTASLVPGLLRLFSHPEERIDQ